MEYRTLPDAHEDRFGELLSYAFRPEAGPDPDMDDVPDDPDIYHRRGFYDIDPEVETADADPESLQATMAYYAFTARVRGDWHPLGGVTAVASSPAIRRQGQVGKMLEAMLAEFREEDAYLSALWPFKHPFYRRYGYAVTNKYARTTLPPDALEAAAGERHGEFRRIESDDWNLVDEVYDEWASEDLALKRTESYWRTRRFQSFGSDPFVYGWYDDAGDLAGYVAYVVQKEGDRNDKRMDVWELAAIDEEAHRQLLRFCRDHDSQVGEVRLYTAVETATDLLDRLDDPRDAEVTVNAGPMLRVVDVEDAVAAIDFPEDVDATVTVAVEDDTLDWNDDTFELVVSDGEGQCRRVDEGAEAEMEVGAFSQALIGAVPVAKLERYGDLAVEDGETLDALDAMFPPATVFLREGF